MHSSLAGRRQHNAGRKHINNKIEYYQNLIREKGVTPPMYAAPPSFAMRLRASKQIQMAAGVPLGAQPTSAPEQTNMNKAGAQQTPLQIMGENGPVNLANPNEVVVPPVIIKKLAPMAAPGMAPNPMGMMSMKPMGMGGMGGPMGMAKPKPRPQGGMAIF